MTWIFICLVFFFTKRVNFHQKNVAGCPGGEKRNIKNTFKIYDAGVWFKIKKRLQFAKHRRVFCFPFWGYFTQKNQFQCYTRLQHVNNLIPVLPFYAPNLKLFYKPNDPHMEMVKSVRFVINNCSRWLRWKTAHCWGLESHLGTYILVRLFFFFFLQRTVNFY